VPHRHFDIVKTFEFLDWKFLLSEVIRFLLLLIPATTIAALRELIRQAHSPPTASVNRCANEAYERSELAESCLAALAALAGRWRVCQTTLMEAEGWTVKENMGESRNEDKTATGEEA
jgi:hypothetical protein